MGSTRSWTNVQYVSRVGGNIQTLRGLMMWKMVPRKILRYFPLIPRLQRLYMNDTTSAYMSWHTEELVKDGKVRHPADSLAWKHVDDTYPHFAFDPRNVRLGLASDGFNPFGMLNINLYNMAGYPNSL